MFGKGGKRRARARAEGSDDEGEGDNYRNFKSVTLDAASHAIAVKWLRTARSQLQARGDEKRPKRRRRPKKGEKLAKSRKGKK